MSIYRMIKLDETKDWNYDFGGVKVFGCYVYDPEAHTYCVCLSPSYELNFVYTDVTREITEEEDSMICEAERESVIYCNIYDIKNLPYAEVEADTINEAVENYKNPEKSKHLFSKQQNLLWHAL